MNLHKSNKIKTYNKNPTRLRVSSCFSPSFHFNRLCLDLKKYIYIFDSKGLPMTTVDQNAIETFIGITGATEVVALQKLKAYRGDLNLAVDSYFNEGNGVNSGASYHCDARDDILNIEDDPMDIDTEIQSFPQNTVTRSGQSVPVITSGSLFERPREIREIPVDLKDGSGQSSHSIPRIEGVTGILAEHEPGIHGTVIVNDDDDDEVTILPAPRDERRNNEFNETNPGPNGPRVDSLNNEIEEQMIMAAIEASKKEAEGHMNHHFDVSHTVDEEAEHEQGMQSRHKGPSTSSRVNLEENDKNTTVNGRRFTHSNTGTSTIYSSDEDVDEKLLLQSRPQLLPIGPHDNAINNPVSEAEGLEPQQNRLPNEDLFQSDEWGGISSVEHDEAVMLEAAMFGGIPEGRPYDFTYPSQISSDGHSALYPWAPRPPSPTLTAQRLLREQQDGEYLAALQADRDKELKATQDAELRHLEELEAEKEAHRKLQEKEEFESELSAKQASLPPEPALDDDNAITLLIRLPDGSRCGRRFLKSDKLQFLFNFIDTGRVVAPGTYRLVRPFPRRAFGEAENDVSLIQLGLTSKQEALFLELI